MAKKEGITPEAEGDGLDAQAILDQLLTIAKNQAELSDRLSDMEEEAHKGGEDSTLIKLANIYFDANDKQILELSFISPLASRPFAEAMALDEMTSEKVRSGETSLNKLLILNYLRFQRSVRGRLMGIGAEAMREQVASEASNEERMQEFEAGKE